MMRGKRYGVAAVAAVSLLTPSLLVPPVAAQVQAPPAPSTSAPLAPVPPGVDRSPTGPNPAPSLGRGLGRRPLADATPGARRPPWLVSARGGAELTFTDNVRVTQNNRESDFIVSPSAGITLDGQTVRTRTLLDATVSYDFYNETTEFDGARFTALGSLDTELLEYLTVNARIASDQERLSPFSRAPASNRSFGENQAQVLTYGVTPTLRWRTGGFATFQATYDFSATNYFNVGANTTNIPLGDSYENRLSLNVASGPDFDRFGWSLDGSVEEQDGEGGFVDSRRRYGSASLIYFLQPNFQLLANGGYDDIREPTLPESVSGVYLTGGFRWALSRRTRVNFEGGVRYRDPYFSGSITFARSQAIVLNATYTQTIDTPQSVVRRNLFDLVRNPDPLLDPLSNIGADPTFDPFGLRNQAFRRRIFSVGVDGTIGRTSYSAYGAYERRTVGFATGNDYRGSVAITHQLARNLSGTISGAYDRLSGFGFSGTGRATTIETRVQLDYSLGARTAASLAYYFQRVSAFPLRTRENVVVLALTRTF